MRVKRSIDNDEAAASVETQSETQEGVIESEENSTVESTENEVVSSDENANDSKDVETATEQESKEDASAESSTEVKEEENKAEESTETVETKSEEVVESVESVEEVVASETETVSEEAPVTEEAQPVEVIAEVVAESVAVTVPVEEPSAEDLTIEFEIPKNLRPRAHIDALLGLNGEAVIKETALKRTGDVVLKELKKIFDTSVKPLEELYKYRDLSNRHFGDPEMFSKPLVLVSRK